MGGTCGVLPAPGAVLARDCPQLRDVPTPELVLDGGRVEPAGGEQDVAVEPEVGELLDEALVALGRAGERGLDALLADLAGGLRPGSSSRLDDVRALGPLLRALGDAAPEPRREAGERARVADGAVRADAQKDRVAVAVVPDLLDGERRAGGLALVPELAARAAPEPRLAGLARAAERLLVHPGEHQHAAVVGVLDDRRGQLRDRPSGLLQLALQLRQPLRPLVDDRRDERRLGAGLERLGEVRGLAGAAGGDHGHARRRPRRARVSSRS